MSTVLVIVQHMTKTSVQKQVDILPGNHGLLEKHHVIHAWMHHGHV